MLDQLLSPQIIAQLKNEITGIVNDAVKSMTVSQPNSGQKNNTGYVKQGKAIEYVGSRALLNKLEENGLSRFMIDGTVRYKVSELDEFMEIFRC